MSDEEPVKNPFKDLVVYCPRCRQDVIKSRCQIRFEYEAGKMQTKFICRSPPFECPICGMKSWHPEDARNRYCGACHLFVDEPGPKS